MQSVIKGLIPVLNLTGKTQHWGPYALENDKWTDLPQDLASRLQSTQGYVVGRPKTTSGFPHILFIVSNEIFYSGGRYYNYQLAVNLARCGCKVTICANRPPCFLGDFERYQTQRRIEWLYRDPTDSDGPFDLVIATPFEDTIRAQEYAEAHNIPCAAVVYETPDWLSRYEPENQQFRTQSSAREVVALKKCDWIIAISETCKKEVHKWLGTPLDRILVIKPAVNHLVADNAKEPNSARTRPLVVFTGRLVGRKSWDKFLLSCLAIPEPFDIAMIGGNPGLKSLGVAGNEQHSIIWHADIDDAEKFRLFKEASVIAVPSRFEGYGIVPGEALHCGKPCVVFDLPVLREVYGNKLVYAEYGNWKDYSRKLVGALHMKHQKPKVISTMDTQRDTLREAACVPFKYRKPSDIKFSFCMIAFNMADWIAPCLDAVYDEAHEIIIAEGAVEWWQRYATPEGLSTDGTTEAIAGYPDPERKIKYIGGKFPTKLETTVEQITGTHYWLLDPDEIYTAEGIAAMRQAIFDNQGKEVFHTKPLHFWHDFEHYATGGIWDTRHLRVCEWKPGHHYEHHTTPRDAEGRLLHEKDGYYRPLSMHVDSCVRYHYGMALTDSESMQRKIEYYEWRDKTTNPVDVREKLEWLDWHPGARMSDGVEIHDFTGEHPLAVRVLTGRSR